jgi:hypothetical protein
MLLREIKTAEEPAVASWSGEGWFKDPAFWKDLEIFVMKTFVHTNAPDLIKCQ